MNHHGGIVSGARGRALRAALGPRACMSGRSPCPCSTIDCGFEFVDNI